MRAFAVGVGDEEGSTRPASLEGASWRDLASGSCVFAWFTAGPMSLHK